MLADKPLSSTALPALRIGNVTVPVPIIQGAMGIAISDASLVAAVGACGGAGTIPAVGLSAVQREQGSDREPVALGPSTWGSANAEALKAEIRLVRSLPHGVVGANVMMAATDRDLLVHAAIEEGVDFLVMGAGHALDVLDYVSEQPTALVPMASSSVIVSRLCRTWSRRGNGRLPDAIILEGPKAGGHIGVSWASFQDRDRLQAYSLETQIPQAVEALKPWEEKAQKEIPLIVAGGVFTGADIVRALEAGAKGVQMGGRFVCTDECGVADEVKRRYVAATDDDVTLVASPLGLPLRVLRNEFVKRLESGERFPPNCQYHCLKTCNPTEVDFCIAEALVAGRAGDMERGIVPCSATIPQIDAVTSVHELISRLVSEAEATVA